MPSSTTTTTSCHDTHSLTVTLTEWFEGFDDDDLNGNVKSPLSHDNKLQQRRKRRLPLIDLRSYESFSKRHLLHCSDDQHQIPINNHLEKRTIAGMGVSLDKRRHDNNGVIVNLPFSTLKSGERSCELPPRNIPFAILIPKDSKKDVERKKEETSRSVIFESNERTTTIACAPTTTEILDFFFATISKATLQSRKAWLVKQIIFESEDVWREAMDVGILFLPDTTKSSSMINNDKSIKTIECPLPRLWKPDYMVETVLLPLFKDKLTQTIDNKIKLFEKMQNSQNPVQSKSQPCFTIVDLGSGAGRDVCFLAEELKYFQHSSMESSFAGNSSYMNEKVPPNNHDIWDVKLCIVGIDNHKGSAKRCLPMWKHRRVNHITKPLLLDLNKTNFFAAELLNIMDENKNENFDQKPWLDKEEDTLHIGGVVCLYAIRFLNRKLIQQIATCQRNSDNLEDVSELKSLISLQPGTIFAMSHFCKRNVGDSWNFDHPKVSQIHSFSLDS